MMNPKYPARDYQEEARQAIVDGFKQADRGLLVLPTGAGKNYVACSVIDSYPNKRILFLADRNELIYQPWEAINEFLEIAPGVEKAEEHSGDERVVVGSIQTLSRRYKQFRPDRWDIIIADEAHGTMSESWQNVLGHFNAKVLGMTATPFRTDGQSLMGFYQTEFYRQTIYNLQDEGWLVPLEICDLGTGIDINAIQIRRGTEGKKFDEQETSQTIEPHLEAIAKELLANHPERRTLAFLPLIEISKKFFGIARDIGLKAEHIDGDDPQRPAKIAAFKRGEYQLLTNSQLLHTGFDAPVCSATLNLTPMFSSVRYQQIVGRSTRPLKGIVDNPAYSAQDRNVSISLSDKCDSLILDPMWQFGQHGLMIPEALSASSPEEAQEIRKKRQRTGQTNLQQAQRDFILAKEQEMLARLEAEKAQRQRREEVVISVKQFALQTGNFPLATYRPVYSHEKAPLHNFDKVLLKQRGLDPESCSGAGEANLAIRLINVRRHHRLAEIPVVIRLIELGVAVQQAYSMKDREARETVRLHELRRQQ
jgi:superfamily II DNA or RNA helicase